MSEVPYFKPHETGPIFPDEGNALTDDVETFLRGHNRDASNEVARENTRDRSEASLKLWLSKNLKVLDIGPDQTK
jgi:hypothetical protein